MKGYPVVLALLTVLSYSCDQDEITSVQSDSFIKYYALNQSNEGTCVCEIPGGGYAALGNTETDLRGSEVCLLLTDEFGNSIQEPKYYGKSGNDFGYCIKSAPGGGFVILGSTRDPNPPGDKEVWLIRTDDLGDTLWTRTFDQKYARGLDDDNGDDEGLWFDFNSKGEIWMVGYTHKTENKIMSKQIWIYYVDQDGNRTNNQTPKTRGGDSDVDEARFIQCIEGDNFLITGISKFEVNRPADSYSFIMYLESDYTDPFHKESLYYFNKVNTSTLGDEANGLTMIDDTTILLCGTRTRTSGGSDAYLGRFNKIFNDLDKFDPILDTIVYFNNAGSSKSTHMLMETDKVYILSTVKSGTDKSSTISVISTDLYGNNPVFLPFGGASQMVSRNFSFTTDGGFIITGTNTNKDIKDISSMVLIKTKAGGKL